MNEAYNDVLKRLKKERLRLSLTQEEMARYARMNQSNYSKIELGSRRLSYNELKYLCDTDIDLYYIFTGCKCEGKYNEAFFDYSYLELLCILNIISSIADLRCVKDGGDNRREAFSQTGLFRLSDWEYRLNRNVFLCLRQVLEYSQCEMAAKLGVDVKKLRMLENGGCMPDSELICKLYQMFKISPAVVLKDKQGLINEICILLNDMDEGTGKDEFQLVNSIQQTT